MYSTDKTFNTAFKYKYITKPETTNTTIKNFKYNTKYYFKIRAYKTNVGYGKWSKTVKIKTKKNLINSWETVIWNTKSSTV